MLALLASSLLFTAVILRKTYTPEINLRQTAQQLEKNLHKKEQYVYNAIDTHAKLLQFKNINANETNGLQLIEELTIEKDIRFITLDKGNLNFWSDIDVIPNNLSRIKEGVSFMKAPNGYYEAIRKSEGDFSVIFFIDIKSNYSLQNQYLQNAFSSYLLADSNIEIADFTDHNVYELHSLNNTYLFSVKSKPGEVNGRFFSIELTLWFLAFMVFGIFIQNVCNYLVRKKFVYTPLALLALVIIALRYASLSYSWPDCVYQLNLFSPALYSGGYMLRSLGDMFVTVLCLCWLTTFLYQLRHRLVTRVPGTFVSYCIILFWITLLIVFSTGMYNVFAGLVTHSNISFDVNNVLNLSLYSIYGLLMLCFSFLIFHLLTETALSVAARLPVPPNIILIIFGSGLVLCSAVWIFHQHEFTPFYLLWGAWVIMRGRAYYHDKGKLDYSAIAVIIFICSLISALSLTNFESSKEHETRKTLLNELRSPDDATADTMFNRMEDSIVTDKTIVNYLEAHTLNISYLKNYFQKLYFDGYLSKYEFKTHIFDAKGQSVSGEKDYSLAIFKDMVVYGSFFKVSKYFYRENENFGFQSYFAILPVYKNNESLGTIVIELKTKAVQISDYFPQLLVEGKVTNHAQLSNYSYAFYSDNNLVVQSGNYIYNLQNNPKTGFKGKIGTYFLTNSHTTLGSWYDPVNTYSHLHYRPDNRNLIIVSKQETPVVSVITSVTFFYIILLVFSVIVSGLAWAWTRIKILTVTNDRIKLGLRLNFDKLLYRTRIQLSIVSAVVVTLVLVGIVTYASISTQYQAQQDKLISEKIARIASSLENDRLTEYLSGVNEDNIMSFDALADSYAADLIMFDRKGNVVLTTQPRIYEAGLVSRHMNAEAFINLGKLQRSEYINSEMIGALNYKAAYAPLRDREGKTLAFLQLPYFSNEVDYRDRIGSLLNVMINIYALIFIAIGLLAVIIARQITHPLNFIQQSLSRTIYGKKNEPILWHRDDEIGALITEYNKMISALEQSAQKLAQSERESAWREMAKQVAHEIKNPLTPLKLGLQLLEKSWREKDPRFDQKFERFSKSFVEQIESLSSIASEFSAFAKMPDTRMQHFNIFEVLNQAVTIFKQMDNFVIKYQPLEEGFIVNADRDQLLRCFNNLLKNAIEATPADRPGVIEISYQKTDKNILFEIKDNGNGIPENMREKIFEPNFTTKSSGTGLGLAFVKNSIENAGGKVWFNTKTGEGTSFYLDFPVAL